MKKKYLLITLFLAMMLNVGFFSQGALRSKGEVNGVECGVEFRGSQAREVVRDLGGASLFAARVASVQANAGPVGFDLLN